MTTDTADAALALLRAAAERRVTLLNRSREVCPFQIADYDTHRPLANSTWTEAVTMRSGTSQIRVQRRMRGIRARFSRCPRLPRVAP